MSWYVYGNGESLYSAFGSVERKSQKIADTGAWRACFQSCSHFVDTTLLDEMGFHGLLIRVVMHRFHSL
jgi:hypothetical protein